MNPPFLLDTNICIEYLRQRNANVIHHIQSHRPDEIRLCTIVVAELFFGAYKKSQVPSNFNVLMMFLPVFLCVPFDDAAAKVYGQVRAALESRGTPIGPNDLLIAATALANDFTLVSHNTTEFSRVPGLKLVDWTLS